MLYNHRTSIFDRNYGCNEDKTTLSKVHLLLEDTNIELEKMKLSAEIKKNLSEMKELLELLPRDQMLIEKNQIKKEDL